MNRNITFRLWVLVVCGALYTVLLFVLPHFLSYTTPTTGLYFLGVFALGSFAIPFILVLAFSRRNPQAYLKFSLAYPLLLFLTAIAMAINQYWNRVIGYTIVAILTQVVCLGAAWIGNRRGRSLPEWRIAQGLCPACGYDLRGGRGRGRGRGDGSGSTTCPECGLVRTA